MNIAAKFMERRANERKSLTGLLPGRLTIKGQQKYLECKLINVSDKGMGIISSTLLANNTIVLLQTHNETIALKVLWSKRDFGKKDLYRYGLYLVNPEVDLISIFEETGCLK